MDYGLQTFNNSGGMTLSSDGLTYGYIGQATLQTVVQPPGPMSGSVGWPSVAEHGHSEYTIDWPGEIIVALPVKANGPTALIFQLQSGSTWTIRVFKSTGVQNAIGFAMQESTEVHVFGMPVSLPSHGFALYNTSGQPTADLSRRPLTFDRHVTFATGVGAASFSGMTEPAVIGLDQRYEHTSVPFDATFNDNRIAYGAWRWDTTNNLLVRNTFLSDFSRSVDAIGAASAVPATSAILLDLATF